MSDYQAPFTSTFGRIEDANECDVETKHIVAMLNELDALKARSCETCSRWIAPNDADDVFGWCRLRESLWERHAYCNAHTPKEQP